MSQVSLHMGLHCFSNFLGAARIRLMMLIERSYREKVEKNGRQTSLTQFEAKLSVRRP